MVKIKLIWEWDLLVNKQKNEDIKMRKLEDEDFYKKLGERLKIFRKKHNFTARYVTDYIGGITYQQYLKYESGKNKISIYKLHHLCEMYNISLEELMPMENILTVTKK